MLCIKNGTIHNAISKEAFIADIMIEDGKIVKIGTGLNADGAEIIDATDLRFLPKEGGNECARGAFSRTG